MKLEKMENIHPTIAKSLSPFTEVRSTQIHTVVVGDFVLEKGDDTKIVPFKKPTDSEIQTAQSKRRHKLRMELKAAIEQVGIEWDNEGTCLWWIYKNDAQGQLIGSESDQSIISFYKDWLFGELYLKYEDDYNSEDEFDVAFQSNLYDLYKSTDHYIKGYLLHVLTEESGGVDSGNIRLLMAYLRNKKSK